MTAISIQRATPADADQIAALTDAAYRRYVPVFGRKPQPMTADHSRLIAEHEVWVMRVGELIAGLLVLIDEPAALLIYSVAVAPDFQGRGLGRRLVAWAETRALTAGHTTVRLYTNERMNGNVGWYAAQGFSETSREPYLGSTLVHMAKALPARTEEP